MATWQELLAKARKAMASAREIRIGTDEVRPMKGQPRVHFDADAITRLADSMAAIGQLYPGIVRAAPKEGRIRYELLDGERRWRAAKQRHLSYRALLVKADDEASSFLVSAVANFNREAHTPTEVSDAIAKMLELAMPMEEIASILGVSTVWAYQIHGLQKLTPKVRAMLDPVLPKDKRLPISAAVQIAVVAPNLQYDLAKRVLEKSLSLRQLRGEAVRVSRKAGAPIRQHKPRDRWRAIARTSQRMFSMTRDLETVMLAPGAEDGVAGARNIEYVQRSITQLRDASVRAARLADQLERLAP